MLRKTWILPCVLLSDYCFADSVNGINMTTTTAAPELDADGDGFWIEHSRQCDGSPAQSTRFKFLDGNAEAFAWMTPDWVYFEYWFPAVYWTGFGSTGQEVEGNQTHCVECLDASDSSLSQSRECWEECVGGNIFLITGIGDDDPIDGGWNQFEATIEVANDPPLLEDDFRLPPRIDNALTHTFDRALEQVTLHKVNYTDPETGTQEVRDSVDYIHGWWHRQWSNPGADKWLLSEETCFTWVASPFEKPDYGLILSGGYYVDRAGVECPVATEQCTASTTSPLPTTTSTLPPQSTVEPKQPSIADLKLEFPVGVCAARNLSMSILIDASQSIGKQSYTFSKDWAKGVLNATATRYKLWDQYFKNQGYDSNLCLRAAVFTFSHKIESIFDLETFGDCYDAEQGSALLESAGRPHEIGDRETGTYTRSALLRNLDDVLPQTRADDARLLVILTDGLPSSLSQDPCWNAPNQLSYAYTQVYDVRTLVVTVEATDEMLDTDVFECLFGEHSLEDSLLKVDTHVHLHSISKSVHARVFEHMCQVQAFACNVPLFPHEFNSTQQKYAIQNISDIHSLAYRFTVDNDEDIWFRMAQLKMSHRCQSEIQLRATIWRENGEFDFDFITHSNEIVVVSQMTGSVHNFTFDREKNNSSNASTVYRMLDGATYVLQVEVNDFGLCASQYYLPTTVTNNRTAPFNSESGFFSNISAAIDFEASGEFPVTWDSMAADTKHNNPLITVCVIELQPLPVIEPKPNTTTGVDTTTTTMPFPTSTVTTTTTTQHSTATSTTPILKTTATTRMPTTHLSTTHLSTTHLSTTTSTNPISSFPTTTKKPTTTTTISTSTTALFKSTTTSERPRPKVNSTSTLPPFVSTSPITGLPTTTTTTERPRPKVTTTTTLPLITSTSATLSLESTTETPETSADTTTTTEVPHTTTTLVWANASSSTTLMDVTKEVKGNPDGSSNLSPLIIAIIVLAALLVLSSAAAGAYYMTSKTPPPASGGGAGGPPPIAESQPLVTAPTTAAPTGVSATATE